MPPPDSSNQGADDGDGSEVEKPLVQMFTPSGDGAENPGSAPTAIFLQGDAAYGKTTGCRRLARLLARLRLGETAAIRLGAEGKELDEAEVDTGLPDGIIPILLRIRELPEDLVGKATLLGWLQSVTPKSYQKNNGILEGGAPCLWIIDGLDEASEADHKSLLNSVEALRDELARRDPPRRDFFLLTSRYELKRQPRDIGRFTLRGLNTDEQKKLAEHYFRIRYPEKNQEDLNRDFSAEIDRRKSEGEGDQALLGNPLMLTLAAFLFVDTERIPETEGELLRLAVRALISFWREEMGDRTNEEKRRDHQYLERVAWEIQCRGSGSRVYTAEGILESVLTKLSKKLGHEENGEAILQRLIKDVGLVVPQGNEEGQFGFLHLAFQDYLAACHAARNGFGETLGERLNHDLDRWRKVALYSVGLVPDDLRAKVGGLVDSPLAKDAPDPHDPGPYLIENFHQALFASLLKDRRPEGGPEPLDQSDDRLLSQLVDPIFFAKS